MCGIWTLSANPVSFIRFVSSLEAWRSEHLPLSACAEIQGDS